MKDLSIAGDVLYLVGDSDASQSTAGQSVVLARRYLTCDELAEHRAILDRIRLAPANRTPEQESYGDAHRARRAWIDGLPIVASAGAP